MPGDPFYASSKWRKLRAAFLKANPNCSVPGCPIPAGHVDHRIRRTAGGASLVWDNLQSFCIGHGNAKTARVDQPGRRANNRPLRAGGCGPDGWPLAPDHPWRCA